MCKFHLELPHRKRTRPPLPGLGFMLGGAAATHGFFGIKLAESF
jgi:hypothetical protein